MKIIVHAGCSKETKNFRVCLDRLAIASPPCDGLVVELVPAPVVRCEEDDECGFGVFVIADKQPPRILIGAKYIRQLSIDGLPREDWKMEVFETICHEWAHMEQFRDGKPLQERGVRVRARTLMREAGVQLN